MSAARKILLGALFAACLAGITAAILLLGSHGRPQIALPETGMEAVEDAPYAQVDWDEWLGINPDIVGWISIPDTVVDFPIVAAPPEDPTYYLSHDVEKQPSGWGAVYLDAACEGHLTDSINAVVFGHNCNDGELFGTIANYSDEQFGRAHPIAYIQTPNGAFGYRVAAAEVIDGTEPAKRIEFRDRKDFEDYYQGRLAKAACVYRDETPRKMVTLCTCSYGSDNERTIVYLAPFEI